MKPAKTSRNATALTCITPVAAAMTPRATMISGTRGTARTRPSWQAVVPRRTVLDGNQARRSRCEGGHHRGFGLCRLTLLGHEVRAVIRNPAKARAAAILHGLNPDDIDVTLADLTDHDALLASLEGVDTLIHAGAVFSLDPRDARRMRTVNPASTRVLLDGAAERGLGRVVHVSSMGVYGADRNRVDLNTPTGPECGAYTGSKIEADEIAVAHQEAGQPVVIVCPGGIIGPRDPSPELSDSMAPVLDGLRRSVVPLPKGACFGMVDVRDVAAVCVGSLTTGSAPARHLLAGHLVGPADLLRLSAHLTGRPVRIVGFPAPLLTAVGWL